LNRWTMAPALGKPTQIARSILNIRALTVAEV
jgi:hypothetical protein